MMEVTFSSSESTSFVRFAVRRRRTSLNTQSMGIMAGDNHARTGATGCQVTGPFETSFRIYRRLGLARSIHLVGEVIWIRDSARLLEEAMSLLADDKGENWLGIL